MTDAADEGRDVRRVEVVIYGASYAIRGESLDEEYVRRVASRVDQRMRELARRSPQLDVTRLAVLTALNLADELTRLQEQYRDLLERFTVRLGELEAAATRPPSTSVPGRPKGDGHERA